MSTRKKRECLKCRNLFTSPSVGRRICPKCSRVNNEIYNPNVICVISDRTLNGKPIPSTRK